MDLLNSMTQQAGRSSDHMELIVGLNRLPGNESMILQYSCLEVTRLVVPLYDTALLKIEQRVA